MAKRPAFYHRKEHVALYPTPHAAAINSQARLFATARLDNIYLMLHRCDWKADPCKSSLLQSAHGQAVAIRPDGAQIAVGDKTGIITLFDSTSGKPVKELPSLGSPIEALSWSQDHDWIAASTGIGEVVVINIGPQLAVAKKQFKSRVTALA